MDDKQIKKYLEYFRQEILAERISAGEVLALQELAEHIDPGDTLLLEWAGVPEGGQEFIDKQAQAEEAILAGLTSDNAMDRDKALNLISDLIEAERELVLLEDR